MDRKTLHYEGQRVFGAGKQATAFELGGEYVLTKITRINNLAEQAYNNAIIRGKRSKDTTHDETIFGILEELREFRAASEIEPSEHLPQYTASVEELADIAICALTELYARVDDVEEVIVAKINYNKTRV